MPARAYAEAAVKSENSVGPAQHGAIGDHQCAAGGRDGLYRGGAGAGGELTVGDLVLVNTFLIQLFRPLDAAGAGSIARSGRGWSTWPRCSA